MLPHLPLIPSPPKPAAFQRLNGASSRFRGATASPACPNPAGCRAALGGLFRFWCDVASGRPESTEALRRLAVHMHWRRGYALPLRSSSISSSRPVSRFPRPRRWWRASPATGLVLPCDFTLPRGSLQEHDHPIDTAATRRGTPALREGFAGVPRTRRAAIVLIPLALVAAAGTKLVDKTPAVAAAPPPAAAVTVAAVPLVREVGESGTIMLGRLCAEPLQSRSRPRVAGEVTGVRFHDGDIVREGQLLCHDRPATLSTPALAEARATRQRARAARWRWRRRISMPRATRLIADEAVSRR